MLEPTTKALQYFEEKAMKAMKRKVAKAKKRLTNFEKHYLALKEQLVNADFTELNQMSDHENTFCFYFTTPMFPNDLFRVSMEIDHDEVWVQATQNTNGEERWMFSGCFEDVNREDFLQYFDHVFFERGRKH